MYGHVITKFSRIDRFPYPWGYAARAWSSAKKKINKKSNNNNNNNNNNNESTNMFRQILVSIERRFILALSCFQI